MTTKTTKEASMYEPRTGDMVWSGQHGRVVVLSHLSESKPWWHHTDRLGGDWAATHQERLTPLRPDAPGQRVRAFVGGVFAAGVTTEPVTDPLRDRRGFVVRWDAGGEGPWETGHLIRIADQAPAAPVKVPRPETPADVCRAFHGRSPQDEPGYIEATDTPGPTCQHCGSNVLTGLLRDACPRGCDLTLRAAEPEPECVTAVWNGPVPRDVLLCESGPCPPGWERLWLAGGCGSDGTYANCEHPTREGAIAAWREAVRRA